MLRGATDASLTLHRYVRAARRHGEPLNHLNSVIRMHLCDRAGILHSVWISRHVKEWKRIEKHMITC